MYLPVKGKKFLSCNWCVFVCVHFLLIYVPVIPGWHAVAEIDKHEWQPGYNACEQEAINMALQDNQGAGN